MGDGDDKSDKCRHSSTYTEEANETTSLHSLAVDKHSRSNSNSTESGSDDRGDHAINADEAERHGRIASQDEALEADTNHISMNSDPGSGATPPMADFYAGTAGYSYAHWRKGVFYPKAGVTQAKELRHYSGIFSAVEINSSFHGVPRAETLKAWAETAKPGFRFSFKVPKDITHEKRLENIGSPWAFFLERLAVLGPARLGPILFQLPPSLPGDCAKLDAIADLTPPGIKVAFEFRNKSWYCDEVFERLRKHGMGLCENISPDGSTLHSKHVTAGTWHYVRFHKQLHDRLETNYTDRQLAQIADKLVDRRRRNIVQHCFFLNDYKGNGPRNAKTLMGLVGERSESGAFVKNWEPDPVEASIRSFFSKNLAGAGTPITTAAAAKNDFSQRKRKATIDSFFGPAAGETPKRPKASPTRAGASSSAKKGTIQSFFSKTNPRATKK